MMDGIKVGDGKVGIDEDMGDGMQCSEHPYRNNPGGICAFCLQEKLGKLVSSSFPLPLRGSSSSSSSPSFRSEVGTTGSNGVGGSNVDGHLGTTSLSLAVRPASAKARNGGGHNGPYQEYHNRRSRIPFLLAKKKKKMMGGSSSSSAALDRDTVLFKRSKSTSTAPGRRSSHFLDSASTVDGDQEDFSPSRRGGFWSFLYPSSFKPRGDKVSSLATTTNNGSSSSLVVKPKPGGGEHKCLGSSTLSRRGVGGSINVVVENDDGIDDTRSPNSQATAASASSFERKVSRSRSVGCGSRSFSGDFFERISTGFGDCTLRRVESQREGKPKVHAGAKMKERVRCGGIFGGFIITSSSSSSSSSSYWVSSSAEEINGKSSSSAHGRTRSWGWAFASPMRAFSKPASSKDGKRIIITQPQTWPPSHLC